MNDQALNFGEIQFINTNNHKIVFMAVGCITLVAIAKESERKDGGDDGGCCYSEAFLRLQLEYLYSGIVFTLTDSVQYMLQENPTLDVRVMLGSTEGVLRGVLDDMNFGGSQSCMFLGGVDVFGPIPSEVG